MAGSLHGSARTPPRVQAELRASEETTGTSVQRSVSIQDHIECLMLVVVDQFIFGKDKEGVTVHAPCLRNRVPSAHDNRFTSFQRRSMNAVVQLASLPDRDNLVAEGWSVGSQICEVAYELKRLTCYVFKTGRSDEEVSVAVEAAVRRMRQEYSISPAVPLEYVDVP